MGVKVAGTVEDADVRHLLWLREQITDRVVDLVVNTGPAAHAAAEAIIDG